MRVAREAGPAVVETDPRGQQDRGAESCAGVERKRFDVGMRMEDVR